MITTYFVQHGIANAKDVDETRALSSAGLDGVRRVAENLKNHGVVVRKIYHSGKLRALQTAECFAEILEVTLVLRMTGLNPNDDPKEVFKSVTEDGVMYIGHLPNMQKVVSLIVTGDASLDVVKFQNSAVACIEIEQAEGQLKWMVTADMS